MPNIDPHSVTDSVATDRAEPNPPSRRTFLRRSGLFAAGVAGGAAAGGIGGFQIAHGDQPTAATTDRVPFYGSNQAGITTTVQDQLMFCCA